MLMLMAGEVMENKKNLYNAYIGALFIFQFGYMQILARLLGGQWVISISTIILIGFGCYINKLHISKVSLIMLSIVVCVLLCSAMCVPDGMNASQIVEIIAKACSAILIAGWITNGEYIYEAFKKVAVINFFSICLYPLIPSFFSMNYMRFGYAMVPSALMFVVATVLEKKKMLWCVLAAVAIFSVVIYGNRGATLVLGVFLLLCLYFSKRIRVTVKVIATLSIVLIVVVILNTNIILNIIDFLYEDLGIQTYSLLKFRVQIEYGLAVASSGRNLIYESIIDLVGQNLLLGVGIGVTEKFVGLMAHNLFLQVLFETGVVGLVIWGVVWISFLRRYIRLSANRNQIPVYYTITVVVSCAFARLLVSSDMWLRPEYWFALTFMFNYCGSKNQMEEINTGDESEEENAGRTRKYYSSGL